MEIYDSMKNNRHLQLVTTKETVKRFNKFYIYMCDESMFEYDLSEHTIYRDEEWVEVVKKDGTVKEAFSLANVMRVKFMKSTAKLVEPVISQPTLKPVI
jgi:hypothetical protein